MPQASSSKALSTRATSSWALCAVRAILKLTCSYRKWKSKRRKALSRCTQGPLQRAFVTVLSPDCTELGAGPRSGPSVSAAHLPHTKSRCIRAKVSAPRTRRGDKMFANRRSKLDSFLAAYHRWSVIFWKTKSMKQSCRICRMWWSGTK